MNFTFKSKFTKISGVGSFALGVPFLILAVVFILVEQNFQRDALPAKGMVVDMIIDKHNSPTDNTERTYYHPVYQFRDANGSDHHVKSSTGFGMPSVGVGDSVYLLYDRTNVENVRLANGQGMYPFVVIFGIFGVFFVLTGLVLTLIVPRFVGTSPTAAPEG